MGRRSVFPIIAIIVVFLTSCRGYRTAESSRTVEVRSDSVLVIKDSVLVIKDSVAVRHVLGRLVVDSIALPEGTVRYLIRTDTITYYVKQALQTKSRQETAANNSHESAGKVVINKTTPRWKLAAGGAAIILLTSAVWYFFYIRKR